MFTHLVLLLVKVAPSLCFAGYDMFPGFNTSTNVTMDPENPWMPIIRDYDTTITTTTTPDKTTTTTTEPPSFDCPEDEKPSNIGPYEVPSEQDLVLLVQKSLVQRFDRYNKKALFLLRDIKEAFKSASLNAGSCLGNQERYRQCLREVNRHCSTITKNMMSVIENHKRNITFFMKGTVCNMAAMQTDPIRMVKVLAVEEATLKFALPSFLRLLHECQQLCKSDYSTTSAKKPRRRLSDQEFVVKHILTKNTLDLIKDSK